MENNTVNEMNTEVQAVENNGKRVKVKKERRKMKPTAKWVLIGTGAVVVLTTGGVILKTILTKKAPSVTEVKAIGEAVEKTAEVAAAVV